MGRLGAGGTGRVYLGMHQGGTGRQPGAALLAEDQGFLRHVGCELDNRSRLPADAAAHLPPQGGKAKNVILLIAVVC
ncbi:hypothetical protein [Streptomyces mirabilis]|uniref:hypothetical protein n=1 Tax=Streptomyces mirabilis TaxID=68239 RepID=UPI00369C680A